MDEQDKEDIPESQVDIINAIRNLWVTQSPVLDALVNKAVYDAPIIKRRQYASYGIIFVIVVVVSALAYCGAVHGSAAASILGAVAGHIFAQANRSG